MNNDLKTSIDVDAVSASILLPNNIRFNITSQSTNEVSYSAESNIKATEDNGIVKVDAIANGSITVAIEEANIKVENEDLISLFQNNELASYINNIKVVNAETNKAINYKLKATDNNVVITTEEAAQAKVTMNINVRVSSPDVIARVFGEDEYWFSFSQKKMYVLRNGIKEDVFSLNIDYAYQIPYMLTPDKCVYNKALYEINDGTMTKIQKCDYITISTIGDKFLATSVSGKVGTHQIIDFNGMDFNVISEIKARAFTESPYYNNAFISYEDDNYWYIFTISKIHSLPDLDDEDIISFKVSKTDYSMSIIDELPNNEVYVYKDDNYTVIMRYEYSEIYSDNIWTYIVNDTDTGYVTNSSILRVFKAVEDKILLLTFNTFNAMSHCDQCVFSNKVSNYHYRTHWSGDFMTMLSSSMDGYFSFYGEGEDVPYRYKYLDEEVKIRHATKADLNEKETTGTIHEDAVSIKLDEKIVFDKNAINEAHVMCSTDSFWSFMIHAEDGDGNAVSPIRKNSGKTLCYKLLDTTTSYNSYYNFDDIYIISKPYKKVTALNDTHRKVMPNTFTTKFSNNIVEVDGLKEVEYANKQEIFEDFEGDSKINWNRSDFTIKYDPIRRSKSMYVGKNKDYNNNDTYLEASFVADALYISFDYFVSTEGNYDFFRFYIDNEIIIETSGTEMTNFNTFSKNLEPGEHEFKFVYNTDASGFAGEDGFFIDNLIISKTTPTDSVEVITEPIDLTLYEDFNCSIAFEDLVNTYPVFNYKIMYSYDKEYWADFDGNLPTRRTVYLKVIFTKSGSGKTTFKDLRVTRKEIVTYPVTVLSDILRPVTITEKLTNDVYRKVIKKINSLTDTFRATIKEKIGYSDTLRKVNRLGKITTESDTTRIVVNSVKRKADLDRQVVKDSIKKFDTSRIITLKKVTVNYTDTERKVIKKVASSNDLIREVTIPAEAVIKTHRQVVKDDYAIAPTSRIVDKYYNLVSKADLLRLVVKKALSKADTTRIVDKATKVTLKADTERKTIKDMEFIADSIRRTAIKKEIKSSTNRQVVNTAETTINTVRDVQALMTILVDTEKEVVKAVNVNADLVRKTYKEFEEEQDLNRQVTVGAKTVADTIREIIKEHRVVKIADTERKVIKKAENAIDMCRNVTKTYISIVDAHRDVVKIIELDTESERQVIAELIAYTDTERIATVNIEDMIATLDVEIELEKGALRIVKQRFYEPIEIEVEEE